MYYMRHKVHCNSRFIIYLVTCKRCRKQYVGKASRTMKARHTQGKCHRQEIRKRSTPLGKHFHSCNYENFELQIIDCYEADSEKLDRDLEDAGHTKGAQCSCEVCDRLGSWEKQWTKELKAEINS